MQALTDYMNAVENWHPIIYNLYYNIYSACKLDNPDAKSWLTCCLVENPQLIIDMVDSSMRRFSKEIEKEIISSDNPSEAAKKIASVLGKRIVAHLSAFKTDIEERREYEQNYLHTWNKSVFETEGDSKNEKLIEVLAKYNGVDHAVKCMNKLKDLIQRINGKVDNVAAVIERYAYSATDEPQTKDETTLIDWEKMKKPKIRRKIRMNELYNFALEFVNIDEGLFTKCILYGYLNPLWDNGIEYKLKRMVFHLKSYFEPKWFDVVCRNLGKSKKYMSSQNFGKGEKGKKLRHDFDARIPR